MLTDDISNNSVQQYEKVNFFVLNDNLLLN